MSRAVCFRVLEMSKAAWLRILTRKGLIEGANSVGSKTVGRTHGSPLFRRNFMRDDRGKCDLVR